MVLKREKTGNRRIVKLFGKPLFSYWAGRRVYTKAIGIGNTIENHFCRCKVEIFGNNNKVIFGEVVEDFVGSIQIGARDCHVDDCIVKIGRGTTSNGCHIVCMENGSEVEIGDDCLISDGVEMWCSDTHTLIDSCGEITNAGSHHIKIGNHVWICQNVTILKDVTIAADSVVGMRSLVTRSCVDTHVVLGGIPARIIKEGISWNKCRPQCAREGLL